MNCQYRQAIDPVGEDCICDDEQDDVRISG
jgi:hypothetical protein